MATEEHSKDGAILESGALFDGRFLIHEFIGQGGSSLVYRATDRFLDRVVVIKLLGRALPGDENYLQRFRREALACSLLKHAGIVQILSVSVDSSDRPYIVMEHISGKSLQQFLQEAKKFDKRLFADVFLPLMDALIYAHGQNVIHLDLKPSNIMIETVADSFIVKIVDFGIAKFIEPAASAEAGQGATGTVTGSPIYMSPEQCAGARVDARSDIYSLACVMYESLVGKPPFLGETALETMYDHLRGSVPKIDCISGSMNIPHELVNLIIRALSKEPAARPGSMAEFHAAVAEALNSTNIVSRTNTTVLGKVMLPAVLVLLVVLVSFFGWNWTQKRFGLLKPAVSVADSGKKSYSLGISGMALLREARELREGKHFSEAIDKNKQAISMLKNATTDRIDSLSIAYENLGSTQIETGDYKGAEESFRRLMRLYDNGASAGRLSAAVSIVTALTEQNKLEEADALLKGCIDEAEATLKGTRSTNLATTYVAYARLLYDRKKFAEGLVAARNALQNYDLTNANQFSPNSIEYPRRVVAELADGAWIAYACCVKLGRRDEGRKIIDETRAAIVANPYDSADALAQFAFNATVSQSFAEARETFLLARSRLMRCHSPGEKKMVAKKISDGLQFLEIQERSMGKK